jgi:hypothetical protein
MFWPMIEAAWMAFGFLGGLITGVLLVKHKPRKRRRQPYLRFK